MANTPPTCEKSARLPPGRQAHTTCLSFLTDLVRHPEIITRASGPSSKRRCYSRLRRRTHATADTAITAHPTAASPANPPAPAIRLEVPRRPLHKTTQRGHPSTQWVLGGRSRAPETASGMHCKHGSSLLPRMQCISHFIAYYGVTWNCSHLGLTTSWVQSETNLYSVFENYYSDTASLGKGQTIRLNRLFLRT